MVLFHKTGNVPLGLVIGLIGIHSLLAVSSENIPNIGPHGNGVVLDWRVLAFTTAISIGSGIAFWLVPALHVSRVDPHSVLKTGNMPTADRHHHRIRSLFVISEMALAVVLVIGTFLLIRTFIALLNVDPGFRSRKVTTMNMSMQGTRFEKTMALSQMAYQAADELMDAILSRSTARSDFTTLLLAIFGVSALVLAAIGMYGLMAYSVEERTQGEARGSSCAGGGAAVELTLRSVNLLRRAPLSCCR